MNNKTERVEMLDTELCYGNPNQPRKYFNQQELQELADSIKEAGQLQPGGDRHLPGGCAHPAGQAL